jgi:hypothetical protein
MNISNFLATALLNQVFRNTVYTRPTTVYLALYTSDPTAVDTGTEVSGGAYARIAVTFGAPAIESSRETIRSTAELVFSIATADWGNITHAGIRDASTAGNLLYYGGILNPRQILTGDRLRIEAGSIVLTLS